MPDTSGQCFGKLSTAALTGSRVIDDPPQRDPGLCVPRLCLLVALPAHPLALVPQGGRGLPPQLHQATLRGHPAGRLDTIPHNKVGHAWQVYAGLFKEH